GSRAAPRPGASPPAPRRARPAASTRSRRPPQVGQVEEDGTTVGWRGEADHERTDQAVRPVVGLSAQEHRERGPGAAERGLLGAEAEAIVVGIAGAGLTGAEGHHLAARAPARREGDPGGAGPDVAP